MRVFRTCGQSRTHPKVCSDTDTSAADTTNTLQKANATTSRLRLNIRLPFPVVNASVRFDLEMPSGRFGLHLARPSQRRNVWRRDGLLKWGEPGAGGDGAHHARAVSSHRALST